MSKTCQRCGSPYDKPNKLYCSRKCAHAALRARESRQCDRCGDVFEAAVGSPKRYCTKRCYYDDRKGVAVTPRERINRKCKTCKKTFEVIPSWVKNGGGKYCSRDCKHEGQRQVTGKDHPLYKQKIKMTCKWCGAEYKVKPSLVKRTKFCSQRCKGSYTTSVANRSETSIEAAMRKILTCLRVGFEQEKRVGYYVCDFVLTNHAVVVECDGDYWHSSKKQQRRDAQKTAYLKSKGFTVVRFSGTEIRTKTHEIVSRISSLVYP